MMKKRSSKRIAGVLHHITSLPGPYGIGDLGEQAYTFVDWMRSCGLRLWQVLPINPIHRGSMYSPYSSPSAFAGNVLLISPDKLFQEGWISRQDLKKKPRFLTNATDYQRAEKFKISLLDKAFNRFNSMPRKPASFSRFVDANRHWLADYACFCVLKDLYPHKKWSQWPVSLRLHDEEALGSVVQSHVQSIMKVQFKQYLFYKQWGELRHYATTNNVSLMGDLPIYVNFDSADVWGGRLNFQLNKYLRPKYVAGVPPDYFSENGQRWGNPVYDWPAMKKDGFNWWVRRVAHQKTLFDYIRIDHFRGLVKYWRIDAKNKTAK
ncbi:MAG: 4-alpha-glucanotransferase, partial [Candidatus Omnitrophica bacterium]|nr:4-alpha-glucanotransferase [Candidatus Omnitrophota bacterium]